VADFSSGVPAAGSPVGEGYSPAWASPTRLVFANSSYENLEFSVIDDGSPSAPQTIIVGATLSGLQILTDVGGDDVLAVKAPLDPCYQENYLVDFNALTFTPIGVSSHATVYFSPDLSRAAFAPYNNTIDIYAPPDSADPPVLTVFRDPMAIPSQAETCRNGVWSPNSLFFASLDNTNDVPWIADFRSDPVVHDSGGGAALTMGTSSSLKFLNDSTLLYRASSGLVAVSIGASDVTDANLNSGGSVNTYSTYREDIVAYAGAIDSADQEIYMRRVTTGGEFSAEEKVSDALSTGEDFFSPSFSGDGSYLLYSVQRVNSLMSSGLAFVDLADPNRAPHRLAPPVSCNSAPCVTMSGFWAQP
jgi:hypothetical protein